MRVYKIHWIDGICRWVYSGNRGCWSDRVFKNITSGWRTTACSPIGLNCDDDWEVFLNNLGNLRADHFEGWEFFCEGPDLIVVADDVDPILFKLLTGVDLVSFTVSH